MNIKKLSHLCLSCKDIPKIIEFYTQVLDCKIVHQFKNEQGNTYGIFLLLGEDTFLEFFLESGNIIVGNKYRHFCIEVSDIFRMAKDLQVKGFNIEPKRGRTDGVLQFNIIDCENNTIEFQQFDEECVQYKFLNKTL